MRYPAVFLLAILSMLVPASLAAERQAPENPVPIAQMSAQELEARGDALRSQKDLASAMEYYTRATQKQPKNAVVWNKMGMVELQLGRFNDARQHFQRASKLKKDYAEAVNNLGVVYYQQGNYRKAISQYRKALSIRDTASFHSNLGAVYFAQKRFPEAMNEYLAALRLDPEVFERTSASGLAGRVSRPEDRAKYAFMLTRLYAQMGDLDHALLQLKVALENGYSDLDPLMKDAEFAELRKDPRFTEMMQNKPATLPD